MIVSIDVIKLVYEHAYLYLARIPELRKMLEQAGAVNLGWFMVEAGGHGEMVCITKWEGINARAKGFESVMKESGMTDLQTQVMKAVQHMENLICISNPAVSQMENFNPQRRLTLRMHKVIGSPTDAAKKYIDMIHYFKDKVKVDSSLLALLHPVAFQGPIGLVSIMEEGEEGIDIALQTMLNAAADPNHAETVRELHKHFETVSSRFMIPHKDDSVNAFLEKPKE